MTAAVAIIPASRTAAATVARRRQKTKRLALELSTRLGDLDDEWLSRLAFAVLETCRMRDVEAWRDEK